jgi:hypothetical protein
MWNRHYVEFLALLALILVVNVILDRPALGNRSSSLMMVQMK